MSDSLCGVWIDDEGRAHVARAEEGRNRREETAEFRPFLWLNEKPTEEPISGISLATANSVGSRMPSRWKILRAF